MMNDSSLIFFSSRNEQEVIERVCYFLALECIVQPSLQSNVLKFRKWTEFDNMSFISLAATKKSFRNVVNRFLYQNILLNPDPKLNTHVIRLLGYNLDLDNGWFIDDMKKNSQEWMCPNHFYMKCYSSSIPKSCMEYVTRACISPAFITEVINDVTIVSFFGSAIEMMSNLKFLQWNIYNQKMVVVDELDLARVVDHVNSLPDINVHSVVTLNRILNVDDAHAWPILQSISSKLNSIKLIINESHSGALVGLPTLFENPNNMIEELVVITDLPLKLPKLNTTNMKNMKSARIHVPESTFIIPTIPLISDNIIQFSADAWIYARIAQLQFRFKHLKVLNIGMSEPEDKVPFKMFSPPDKELEILGVFGLEETRPLEIIMKMLKMIVLANPKLTIFTADCVDEDSRKLFLELSTKHDMYTNFVHPYI